MLHRRHYTVEQADELLSLVGRTVRDLRDARGRLAARGFDTELAVRAEATGGAWPGPERAADALAITLGFERLEELDVLVRDLERGVIDFPSVIEGREVYLCWVDGERDIEFWHDLDAGYAGRQAL
jgi:hypothetical protein